MVDHRHRTETITATEGEAKTNFSLPERWRLERVLGVGGQGEVWLAFDQELRERVAVKVLARPDRPTAVERLKREVRIGRKLRHEHLVQIYELVDAGTSIAIVMEYLGGGSLSERLGDGKLEIAEVERIGEALLEALACLHREGIVHRDVKPSNVLFDSEGVVKLADLGTLRPMDEAGDLTATNLTVGTPAYMSPEQVRGEEPAPPSDLYSLGVTFYHLLAGQRPFEGGSEFDVARMQVTDEAPPVRRERGDCPWWLARFVHRLLEKDSKNRWVDADEALKAFRARRWRPTRRALVRATAAIAVVALVGALGLAGIDRMAEIRPSVEGGVLVVRNAFGRTLWQEAIEGLQPLSVALDLAPGGGQDVLAGVVKGPPGRRKLDLRLFSRSGLPLKEFRVTTDYSGVPQFPGMSETLQITGLDVIDLGRGLGDSAVWTVTDRSWYPGAVGVWSAVEGQDPKVVLVNSGHFRAGKAFDFNGDGRNELVVAGVNNELGFQAFAAIVDPGLFPSRSPELTSPEQITSAKGGLLSYALLGEESEPDILIEPGGNVSGPPIIQLAHRTVEIDVDGAIDGLSMEATMAFWADTVHTAARLQNLGSRWDLEVEQLGGRHAAVWPRPPYRAGAAFIMAKALADAGHPEGGARILEDAKTSGVQMRRLNRRIGELRLLAGDRPEGRAALRGAIDSMGQGFGPVDELLDLGLDDALTQDDSAWRETSKTLGSFQFDHYRRQLEVFFNFYGGRFSSCGLDLKMGPGILHSAFVLKSWAAIEEGRADTDTIDKLRSLEMRAECQALATLALARSEVLAGRHGEAAARAGEALWQMQDRALSSWPDAVYLPLVQWAYGTVLEAGGNIDEAQSHYEAATTMAPNTFFGKDAAARLGSWNAGMQDRARSPLRLN
jgi:hypothetical protein